MNDSNLIKICEDMYTEANDIYLIHRAQLGQYDFGYKILYGPPHKKCPILFIGDQPGGKVADEKPNERYGWPSRCEYATESWTLARNMQSMFGIKLLEQCVGMNANFFRSPDAIAWKKVEKTIRTVLEGFCLSKLSSVIASAMPQQIVTIGFATLKKFGPTEPLLYGTKDRVLMQRGKIGSWPAVSTLHLSGAQIAEDDRRSIANKIRALAAGHET